MVQSQKSIIQIYRVAAGTIKNATDFKSLCTSHHYYYYYCMFSYELLTVQFQTFYTCCTAQ